MAKLGLPDFIHAGKVFVCLLFLKTNTITYYFGKFSAQLWKTS